MVLAIVPSDLVTPFQTGNTLQIVFMAVMVGMAAVMIGSKTEQFREMLGQANMVTLRLVESICGFMAVYIVSSLTLLFWENGMAVFRSLWKPLLLCMVLSFLLMGISLAWVSLKLKAPLLRLLRKVLPGYLIGLTTASSTAAFGTMLEENEHALGIDPQLSNFGTPLGMILCSPSLSVGFLAILYFLAEYEHTEVSLVWFIVAWLVVTIVAVAIPPVSGGTLIGLGVVLAQLQISDNCLGIAGSLVLMGDFFMTSAKIVIQQMELVLEADHWKLLDPEKLRS